MISFPTESVLVADFARVSVVYQPAAGHAPHRWLPSPAICQRLGRVCVRNSWSTSRGRSG
jgi:hypothetical protein